MKQSLLKCLFLVMCLALVQCAPGDSSRTEYSSSSKGGKKSPTPAPNPGEDEEEDGDEQMPGAPTPVPPGPDEINPLGFTEAPAEPPFPHDCWYANCRDCLYNPIYGLITDDPNLGTYCKDKSASKGLPAGSCYTVAPNGGNGITCSPTGSCVNKDGVVLLNSQQERMNTCIP